ncbi:MAG: hypothetical protein N3A54_05190 [Patescibacteria group bacterium]|nr:hypothetical protein [Patescibacteria group bacterium]
MQIEIHPTISPPIDAGSTTIKDISSPDSAQEYTQSLQGNPGCCETPQCATCIRRTVIDWNDMDSLDPFLRSKLETHRDKLQTWDSERLIQFKTDNGGMFIRGRIINGRLEGIYIAPRENESNNTPSRNQPEGHIDGSRSHSELNNQLAQQNKDPEPYQFAAIERSTIAQDENTTQNNQKGNRISNQMSIQENPAQSLENLAIKRQATRKEEQEFTLRTPTFESELSIQIVKPHESTRTPIHDTNVSKNFVSISTTESNISNIFSDIDPIVLLESESRKNVSLPSQNLDEILLSIPDDSNEIELPVHITDITLDGFDDVFAEYSPSDPPPPNTNRTFYDFSSKPEEIQIVNQTDDTPFDESNEEASSYGLREEVKNVPIENDEEYTLPPTHEYPVVSFHTSFDGYSNPMNNSEPIVHQDNQISFQSNHANKTDKEEAPCRETLQIMIRTHQQAREKLFVFVSTLSSVPQETHEPSQTLLRILMPEIDNQIIRQFLIGADAKPKEITGEIIFTEESLVAKSTEFYEITDDAHQWIITLYRDLEGRLFIEAQPEGLKLIINRLYRYLEPETTDNQSAPEEILFNDRGKYYFTNVSSKINLLFFFFYCFLAEIARMKSCSCTKNLCKRNKEQFQRRNSKFL